MSTKALRLFFVLIVAQVNANCINSFAHSIKPLSEFSILYKVFIASLASPANVADKIGDKGGDLGQIISSRILDKIGEMVPDENPANIRKDDMLKLVKGGLDMAVAKVPSS